MSNQESSDLARSPVPNTTHLQESIIAQTAVMPQFSDNKIGDTRAVKRRWWPLLPVSLAFAACALFAVLIVLPTGNVTETVSPIVVSEKIGVASEEIGVASEELEWQDILLVEDEWLLADL